MGSLFNWRQIKAIKKNIKKLYEQNLLQEQQILDLAHYLNLTATEMSNRDSCGSDKASITSHTHREWL